METMETTINDLIPFIDIDPDNNILLGRNGEMTVGFKIQMPPIFTKELNYYNYIHKALTNMISSLPNYCRLHKQDFFTLQEIQLPGNTYLEKERQKMFTGKQIICQESYVYLTAIPPQIHNASIVNNSSFHAIRSFGIPKEGIKKFVEAYTTFCSQFEATMKKEKEHNCFDIQQLTIDNFLGIDGVVAKSIYLDKHVYSDITFSKRSHALKIGHNIVEIISIPDLDCLPLSISPTKFYKPFSTEDSRLHMNTMTRLGPFLKFPHIINTIISKGDTEKEKKDLESRVTLLENFASVSRENRIAAEDTNEFLETQARYGGEIVDCHVNIITWAENPEILLQRRLDIVNSLKALNIVPKISVLNKANLFFASTPGGTASIFKEMRFKTTAQIATCFLLLDDLQRNTECKTTFQLTDRFTGTPLAIDISDTPFQCGWIENLNKFVIGSSGSGKSVLMNYFTKSNLDAGANVVIIDMGYSYEGLCDVYNGKFIVITAENPLSFNPFLLNKYDLVQGKLTTIKTQTLLGILRILWKGITGIFSETENSTLERMLDSYYAASISNRNFNTFYEYVTNQDTFSVNPDINFNMNEFRYVLETYYKGGKDECLLNSNDPLSLLEYKLVVFEISGIKDTKLFPIMAFIIMDTIMAKLNLPGRKEILLDEAWKVLVNPQMETFFQELIKTIRKLNGEPIFVTQEIEDLISSNIIKNSIINNCPTKILLSQSLLAKRFDALQQLLGLTDHEKALILSLNKNKTDNSRDFFVSYSNGPAAVYSLKLSYTEYLICTSRQEEKLGIKKVAKYLNSSYYEAIRYIVAELTDKIEDEIKQSEKKGKKLQFNQAVDIVLKPM
jgi:conjugation system ATPase, TraG family